MTLVVMALIYTGPSLYRMIKFKLSPKIETDDETIDLINDLSFSVDSPSNNSSSSVSTSDSVVIEARKKFKDNWFYYPKLGIEAPMIWDVTIEQIEDRLLGGVVQLDQSAKPGEYGDIIVSGHSSFYPWVESDYKETFAVLPKAERRISKKP